MARIVVIDDDPGFRDLLSALLKRSGRESLLAGNGKEGLQLCSAHLPDLVVTDLIMPEEDGLELIQKLRAQYPILKILAISGAMEETQLLRMASRLGATRTMAKPFTPEEFLEQVDGLLAGQPLPLSLPLRRD